MTQFLPPNLLALFAPRDPIPFLPPVDKLPHEKKATHNYQGVAQYVHLFEDPVDTPPLTVVETRAERRDRRKKERAEQVAYKLEQEIALWDPNTVTEATGDPFKTLFIARVNFYTSESKLKREFEQYGSIKSIRMVMSTKDSKPRGYAFIEFEHEKDMHSAYKHADGKKIDGRRVLVDVERGRTVKGWLPRRLGGGLGGTRRGAEHENMRHSGRDDARRDRDSGSRRRSRSRDTRKRSRSRDRKRRDSRDRKRSRSRDRKRSKRSRSRSRERRRKERKEEGGIKVKDEPMEYKDEQDPGAFDQQGVNVKQEGVEGNGQEQAEQEDIAAPEPAMDRNMPTGVPGEEGEYGY